MACTLRVPSELASGKESPALIDGIQLSSPTADGTPPGQEIAAPMQAPALEDLKAWLDDAFAMGPTLRAAAVMNPARERRLEESAFAVLRQQQSDDVVVSTLSELKTWLHESLERHQNKSSAIIRVQLAALQSEMIDNMVQLRHDLAQCSATFVNANLDNELPHSSTNPCHRQSSPHNSNSDHELKAASKETPISDGFHEEEIEELNDDERATLNAQIQAAVASVEESTKRIYRKSGAGDSEMHAKISSIISPWTKKKKLDGAYSL